MIQIPLYHRGRETGQLITLDDHLFAILSHVHWSTGDVRRPQSPRHVARLRGEPFTVSLNRVVYALRYNPKLVDRDIFDSELSLLKYAMSEHPPLVFEDGNVLNCTLANILPRALSRKGMKPRDMTSDGDSPPFAQEPSPLDRKILGNETAERLANIAPFAPHASRDVTSLEQVERERQRLYEKEKGADLAKLFTHLDAQSDPSISRTNDTNKKGT